MLVKFSKVKIIFFKFNLSVIFKVGQVWDYAVISYFTPQIYPTVLRYQPAT
jgi:hypothetical protein